MKMILCFFLFVISFKCLAQQPYQPLLGNTNKWLIIGWFEGCTTDSLYTSGDTIINSRTYKVLKGTSDVTPQSTVITGYLREDSLARKVYALKVGDTGAVDTTERVLYDFSLAIGDTILLYNSQILKRGGGLAYTYPDTFGYYILDTITNVPIQQGISRLFHLKRMHQDFIGHPANNTTWLEGVGEIDLTSSGATGNLYLFFLAASSVSCAYRDGVQTIANHVYGPGICYCNLVDVKEVQKAERITVVPNPAFDYLTFEQLSPTSTIYIYNSTGVRHHAKVSDGKIDITTLVPGIYHIVIGDKGILYRGAFIKQ